MLESVWTPPRPDCPRPDWWHCDDGESTEHEVTALVAGLVTALQPQLVVETGAGFGQTTQAVGRALAGNGHGRLVSLELDPDRCAHARARCAGLPVEVVCGSSLDWTPPQPVDLMWLDSAPGLRAAELRRFAEHATSRCVVGVHDTATHRLIRDQLEQLAAAGVIWPPLYLPTPRGVCFTRLQPGRG